MEPKIAIVGWGHVGQAYGRMFPHSLIYDEPKKMFFRGGHTTTSTLMFDVGLARDAVNKCDMAIVAVPTNTDLATDELDMSIVEEVLDWLETPLILIKSALQPGTTDRLVAKTGMKIAVSVELIGESRYFVPFWKHPHPSEPATHSLLVVGGETETASKCVDILWSKMSPDIDIHIVSAIEAEICKMMENAYGALKVTFANTMYDICEAYGADYKKVLQAWGADGRMDKMHMRVVGSRGWDSHCWNKDIPALIAAADKKNVPTDLLEGLLAANEVHRSNDGN